MLYAEIIQKGRFIHTELSFDFCWNWISEVSLHMMVDTFNIYIYTVSLVQMNYYFILNVFFHILEEKKSKRVVLTL